MKPRYTSLTKNTNPYEEGGINMQKKEKWIDDFMYSRKLNVEECAKALEVLYSVDVKEYMLEHFTSLSLLKESLCRKAAFRLNSCWFEREIFPMCLFYMFSDKNSHEKKITSLLHNCLLNLKEQVNRLSVGQSGFYEVENTEEDEQQKEEVMPSDSNELSLYQDKKGRNFSIYYTNGYLYFTIYRYLFEKNVNNLAQLFQIASEREILLEFASKSRQELLETPMSSFIGLWRILNLQGIYQDLQDAIFRYMLLMKPSSINEAMIVLSFIYRENQVQENIAKHLMFVSSYVIDRSEVREEDLEDQKKVVEYVLKNIQNQEFEEFSNYLPAFREFIETNIEKTKGDKSHVSHVCPLSFYGPYFPQNDLCYLSNRMKSHQESFFEEYLEDYLRKWISKTKAKRGHFEEAVTEVSGIEALSQDFQNYYNTSVIAGEESEDKDGPYNKNHPRTTINSLHQTKSDEVGYIEMKEFVDYVKNHKNIRIFNKSDLMLNPNENIAPDYLKNDSIAVYEGYLALNNQRCNVFKVNVIYTEHLQTIKANIDLMNIYSPVVIKYLGLYFSDDITDEFYSIYFVTDWWQSTLFDHVTKIHQNNPKELTHEVFIILYRILFFIRSAELTCLPIPVLTPFHIYMGKNGYPQFLIPFFTAAYYCHRPYFASLFRDQESMAKPLHYFAYPNFEQLPDPVSLKLIVTSKDSKIANIMLHDDQHHQDTCFTYLVSRTIAFILSGQIPMAQSKPISLANLLTLLKNEMKVLPTILKLMANLKKKTEPIFKGVIDSVSNLLLKPERSALLPLLEKLNPLMPQFVKIRPNISYTLDILNTSTFIEDDNIGENIDAPLRRIILLPSKLVFNGHVHQDMIASARFYHLNNLILSIAIDVANHSVYTADYFVDERRTVMVKMTDGVLDQCTYMVKSGNDTGAADIVSGERTINIDKYFEDSWVAHETAWTNVIKPFINSDVEDSKFCSVSEISITEAGTQISRP